MIDPANPSFETTVFGTVERLVYRRYREAGHIRYDYTVYDIDGEDIFTDIGTSWSHVRRAIGELA